jgi:peptidoglycan/LPS O-acetylase OafA/YrhL
LRFADVVSQPITDVIITIGATTTVACRELTAFPLAPRFFAWAAGFSFSLYAIHAPFIYFAVTLSQQLGFPLNMPPSPTPFMELALTVSLCLSAAYLFSLVTERKTKQVRDALVGMYSPIVARKISIAVK